MQDNWLLVDFLVPRNLGELFADRLWAMGVVAIEEREESDRNLVLRTSMGFDPKGVIEALMREFPNVESSLVEIEKSVAETWREHAEIIAITEDVVLVPAWLNAPPGTRPVYIEPLDTFGLGNHPTTILTLRLALRHVTPHARVFDFGCGSGVLAVALSNLQGNHCDVFDIADNARNAVQMNSERNGVTSVAWNENFASNAYDVVLANILAPVLREESATIHRIVSDGGHAILSGMRVDQTEGVLTRYDGFIEIDREELDGWNAVVLRKTS